MESHLLSPHHRGSPYHCHALILPCSPLGTVVKPKRPHLEPLPGSSVTQDKPHTTQSSPPTPSVPLRAKVLTEELPISKCRFLQSTTHPCYTFIRETLLMTRLRC